MKGEGKSGRGLELPAKRCSSGPPVQIIVNSGLKINTRAKHCINGPAKANVCEEPPAPQAAELPCPGPALPCGMSVRARPPPLPLLLLLWALPLLARGAQPVLCAPCTPERLALCPPVPPECPEAARLPGCSCCQTCALGPGQPCGVYTARCRLGLRCRAPPGEPRPLSALIQGRGTCRAASEAGGMRTEEPAGTAPPHGDRGGSRGTDSGIGRAPRLETAPRAPGDGNSELA